MNWVNTKTDMNACYTALKQHDEVIADLLRTEKMLEGLGIRPYDTTEAINILSRQRAEYETAIREYRQSTVRVSLPQPIGAFFERREEERIERSKAHRVMRDEGEWWQGERVERPLGGLSDILNAEPHFHGYDRKGGEYCVVIVPLDYDPDKGEAKVGNKIQAIKDLRRLVPSLGLKEAKDFIEVNGKSHSILVDLSHHDATEFASKVPYASAGGVGRIRATVCHNHDVPSRDNAPENTYVEFKPAAA